MRIGILGSGSVGVSLAKGFIAEGHEVWLATHEPDGDKGKQLKNDAEGATICDFFTAAKQAELAILCVKWDGVEDTIKKLDASNLAGKIVIDTSNLIRQEASTLVYAAKGEVSGAEQVQTWLPDSQVVKAFNTVGAATMYKPNFGDQKPTMFIAGNDNDAKDKVREIVEMFGWEALDSGSLLAARSLEPMALVWINYSMATGSPHHAFKML
jgi:predicted dinucleotide-binding enzyme